MPKMVRCIGEHSGDEKFFDVRKIPAGYTIDFQTPGYDNHGNKIEVVPEVVLPDPAVRDEEKPPAESAPAVVGEVAEKASQEAQKPPEGKENPTLEELVGGDENEDVGPPKESGQKAGKI